MVSTRKKRNRQEKQLSQSNETLNDSIIGNGTNMSGTENESLEQQINGEHNDFEKSVDSASQNQIIGNIIDDKFKEAVDKTVLIVKTRMHNAILTAMEKVVIPRNNMVVKSIAGSSGHGPNSEVENFDRRDFVGNAVNTPLMSVSTRLDLNTNHDRIDQTRNEENFLDGDFPPLRPNYDQRTQVHHNDSLYNVLTLGMSTFSQEMFMYFDSVNNGELPTSECNQ